jgi:hypothetical protein
LRFAKLTLPYSNRNPPEQESPIIIGNTISQFCYHSCPSFLDKEDNNNKKNTSYYMLPFLFSLVNHCHFLVFYSIFLSKFTQYHLASCYPFFIAPFFLWPSIVHQSPSLRLFHVFSRFSSSSSSFFVFIFSLFFSFLVFGPYGYHKGW